MSDLEQQFKDAVAQYKGQIDARISEAADALRAAVRLSEESGIPFYSHISFLSQTYSPSTVDKWKDIEEDLFVDEVQTHSGDGYGWEHSAAC